MINPPIQFIGIPEGGEASPFSPFDLDEIYLAQKHSQMWFQKFFGKSHPTTNYRMHWLTDAILQTQIPSNPQGRIDVFPPHDPQVQVGGSVINHYLRQGRLRREIDELLETYGVEDWDGEGAFAIKPSTVKIAKEVANEFPDDIAKPDVVATPHGEIDFDWFIRKSVMLTVSIDSSAEIAYAATLKSIHLHGSEPWIGSLPCFIECCFEQLRSLSDV